MKAFYISPVFIFLAIRGIICLQIEEIKNASSLCIARATCPEGKRNRLDMTMDWNDVNCFCDDLCMKYGDCCPNAKAYDTLKTQLITDSFDCVSVYNYVSYYMKGKCLSSWSDQRTMNYCARSSAFDEESQSDIFLHTPVTSSSSDITYSNYYCAVCNNETLEDIISWEAKVSCQTAELIEDSYVKEKLQRISGTWGFVEEDGKTTHYCDIYPTAKETVAHKLRKCKKYVKKCDNKWTNEKTKDLCYSYTTIMYGPLELKNFSNGISQFGPSVYRNYHCAMCNFVNETDVTCYERDFRQAGYPVPLSFSTLFDFGVSDTLCENGYIWDSFFRKCRSVICLDDHYIYNAGRCVKIYNDGDDISLPEEDDDAIASIGNVTLQCDQMYFSNQEFSFVNNNTIVILPYRRTYHEGEYRLLDDGVMVCVPEHFSRLMGWLTMLGIGLSCVCITIHLIMFTIVPDLQNLSGKNLASMCISLLVGYICFLIVTFKEAETKDCRILGYIMYYGFMSSFTWMNVMSYDVFRTLQRATSQLRLSVGKQWRKFIRYSIYAWLIPALLLIFIVYLDLYKPNFIPEYLYPELGERQCWFGQRQGILLYFAIPLAIIMIVNITLFIISVKFVANTAATANTLKSTKPQEIQLKLYLRLGLLMGISWVTGIIAGYLQIEYFWYIFILLNAFEGVYILLGFTCTTRVRKYVRSMSSTKTLKNCYYSGKRPLDCNDSLNSNVTNTTSVGSSTSTPLKT